MNKQMKRHALIFAIMLLVIAMGFLVLGLWVASYNKEERIVSFSAEDTQEVLEEKGCQAQIYPRGGSTDSWEKMVENTTENGETEQIQCVGIIYELKISNCTEDKLSDWKAKVTMPKDGYINNAWCGKLELHQAWDGQEKVQTLDLRDYVNYDIALNYEIMGSDLMIPLKAGDYFIYLPSATDGEDTITALTAQGGEYPSKTVGFIAYFDGLEKGETLEFPDISVTYHLEKMLTKMILFRVLVFLTIIWFIALVAVILGDLKVQRLLARQAQDEEIIEQSISTFMGFIDAKDSNTNGHSRRVAHYAEKLARRLGYTEEECHQLYYIALMHDCGKIGIPEAILKKPGKLTDEEYDIIKSHTTLGGELLKNFTSLEHIRDGALYHHERYDGKGYPAGLSGENIPITGRIICVADSFDAMNSARCYRSKLSPETIMEELISNRGAQFDPKVVDCMIELLKAGEIEF